MAEQVRWLTAVQAARQLSIPPPAINSYINRGLLEGHYRRTHVAIEIDPIELAKVHEKETKK